MRKQPGRKSSNFGLRVDGSPPPLAPPRYLTAEESKLFQELIAACDTKAFVESDKPLIVSYVQATLMARQTARDPKRLNAWEKAVKLQATLATRLRLAPQARIDRYTASRQQVYQGKKPWEDDEEELPGPWNIKRPHNNGSSESDNDAT